MSNNGKILPFPDTAAVEAEAAAWVARFDAGDVSAKDQAAFQAWLDRSALHRAAVAEYGTFWSEFEQLGQLTGSVHVEREFAAQTKRSVLFLKARPWLAACAADPQAAFDLAPALPHPQRPLRAQVHVLDPFAAGELDSDRILVRTGPEADPGFRRCNSRKSWQNRSRALRQRGCDSRVDAAIEAGNGRKR